MDLEYDETYLHDSVIVDKIKKSFGVIKHRRAPLLFSLVRNPIYSRAFASMEPAEVLLPQFYYGPLSVPTGSLNT